MKITRTTAALAILTLGLAGAGCGDSPRDDLNGTARSNAANPERGTGGGGASVPLKTNVGPEAEK